MRLPQSFLQFGYPRFRALAGRGFLPPRRGFLLKTGLRLLSQPLLALRHRVRFGQGRQVLPRPRIAMRSVI